MKRLSAKTRRVLMGISPEEATVSKRGFHIANESQRIRIERIGHTFLRGYHCAVEEPAAEELETQLSMVESEYRGFAFEGAAMALALLDLITPWNRNRVARFLEGPGAAHRYMVHVGVGWAFGRIPFGLKSAFSRLDPLLRWLALDGYGFHEGYFRWREYVTLQRRAKRLDGYASRAFDQGLGRSLWFVEGSDVARIAETINTFDSSRRADLWSGVGLACAYAGSIAAERITALRVSAGSFQLHLAQGAAFAAKARQHAGNPASHTEMACQILCGVSADAAASITDLAREHLPVDGGLPAYEMWRGRIQTSFAKEIAVQ